MKLPEDLEARRSALDQVTGKVIAGVHEVSNVLGAGFLEKVYENALAIELRNVGHSVEQQHRIEVLYKNVMVGDFVADLLVDECVIVEVKAINSLNEAHAAQCLNYLRATGLRVCLLINFGTPKATVKRIVHNF
jgi:GxxExxY protein